MLPPAEKICKPALGICLEVKVRFWRVRETDRTVLALVVVAAAAEVPKQAQTWEEAVR